MFEWILNPNTWLSLGILSVLEIVLSIDNVIFISIIVSNLPFDKQNKVRYFGLISAMLMRLLLLTSVSWIIGLTYPVFTLMQHSFSARDIILLIGSIFLLYKSSKEIISITKNHQKQQYITEKKSFLKIIIQIIFLDIIFSLDSVITAIGISNQLFIMMIAVIISVIIMILISKKINKLIDSYPKIKILALSFLILVGINLFFESFNLHIPKGYIYSSMFFAVIIEILNLLTNKKFK